MIKEKLCKCGKWFESEDFKKDFCSRECYMRDIKEKNIIPDSHNRILVLAESIQAYNRWWHNKHSRLKDFDVRYVPPRSLSYFGNRECRFVKVGNVAQAGYPSDMLDYFRVHSIEEVANDEMIEESLKASNNS